MIQQYLTLALCLLAGLAGLIYTAFALRRCDWIAKPPGIDLAVVLLTVGPWVFGWIGGVRIHGHWTGGFAGCGVAFVCQFLALEFFHALHTWHARKNRVA